MRLSALVLLLGLASLGRATSLVPPSFPELVAEAEAIYRARVTDLQARHVTAPDGTAIIKTYVTFAVERTFKGADRAAVTLEFLGGTVGPESMVVSGMPVFNLGGAEYVFVQRNGIQFCPLVAMGHGRYRILRHAAGSREYLVRDNGLPLTDLAEVEMTLHTLQTPLHVARAAAAVGRALTPAAFEAGILSELRYPTLRARPQ
jgi:hypothetical protein